MHNLSKLYSSLSMIDSIRSLKKPDLEYYFISRKIKKEALYVSAMLTVTAIILLFSIILMVLVSSHSYLFNINNVVIAQRDNTSLSNGYNDNNSSSGTIASNRSDDGL